MAISQLTAAKKALQDSLDTILGGKELTSGDLEELVQLREIFGKIERTTGLISSAKDYPSRFAATSGFTKEEAARLQRCLRELLGRES